jgi:hypothetical protein
MCLSAEDASCIHDTGCRKQPDGDQSEFHDPPPRRPQYTPRACQAAITLRRPLVANRPMSALGLGRVKTFSCRRSELDEVATRAIFPDFDYALIAAISG